MLLEYFGKSISETNKTGAVVQDSMPDLIQIEIHIVRPVKNEDCSCKIELALL